ncbi:uncharacterized protein EAF02_008887 [Botrytis sinoallii]|uniref:uncharacterized protein n=1 Tax=Botrytis sinoallii TaxID=1463999 RepID=UPI0019003EF3|nr:uncharacterized protein EAF02_008887 [Botrytis sinoallii]KAF7872816.1 hypothetical protein EAF02_008887 [Botrytis sinoallii]
MDYSDAFRLVNLAVGVFMVLGGISQFFPLGLIPNSTTSLALCILPLFLRWTRNLLRIRWNPSSYTTSLCASLPVSLIGIIGLIYIGLEFVPSIEQPAKIVYTKLFANDHSQNREADGGWGAEQV